MRESEGERKKVARKRKIICSRQGWFCVDDKDMPWATKISSNDMDIWQSGTDAGVEKRGGGSERSRDKDTLSYL